MDWDKEENKHKVTCALAQREKGEFYSLLSSLVSNSPELLKLTCIQQQDRAYWSGSELNTGDDHDPGLASSRITFDARLAETK